MLHFSSYELFLFKNCVRPVYLIGNTFQCLNIVLSHISGQNLREFSKYPKPYICVSLYLLGHFCGLLILTFTNSMDPDQA